MSLFNLCLSILLFSGGRLTDKQHENFLSHIYMKFSRAVYEIVIGQSAIRADEVQALLPRWLDDSGPRHGNCMLQES